jgi:DNA-binding transcriptional regulator YbjK
MKENGKNNYVLTHEQHHFDITYLSTLAFIEKLKQAKFTVANYREKLQAIYTNTMEEMEQLQHQYDDETRNGRLKEIQLTWNKKIEERLTEIAAK